jgi:hypothetical protein
MQKNQLLYDRKINQTIIVALLQRKTKILI